MMGGGGLRRCRYCLHQLSTAIIIILLLLASASGFSLTQLKSREDDEEGKRTIFIRSGTGAIVLQRLRGIGPGSSPPSCRSKCGKCTPCKPVHVPIHPGMSLPLEYYPEAWRCKCGDKLFMP